MMLNWILSSSVLILGIVGIRFMFQKKMKCTLQYALWLLVLIRLLVPFSIGHSSFSVSSTVNTISPVVIEHSQVSEQPRDEVPMEKPPVLPAGGAAHNPGMENQPASSKVEKGDERISFQDMLPRILYGVWITGSLVMGMTYLSANLTFRRKLKISRHRIPAYPHKLPVYVTNRIQSPCLFGLSQPAIYLTRQVVEDENMIRHTVAHEFTHYRHGDHVWAILRGVCLTIHWFNPLVWLAAILSQRDAELACDEDTIKVLGEGERKAYGMTLIHVSCQKNTNLLTAATTMTADKKVLKQRIQTIARKRKNAALAVIAVSLLAAAFVGCTFTGSKMDREIDSSLQEDGALTSEQEDTSQPPEKMTDPEPILILKEYRGEFPSADGTASYRMDVSYPEILPMLPEIAVTPHNLTAEDAKRAAFAIFPEGEFMEAEPVMAERFTRQELSEKLAIWNQYTSLESLQKLSGEETTEYLQDTLDNVLSRIEEYGKKLEQIPADFAHTPCQWTMKKDALYFSPEDQLSPEELADSNDAISAWVQADGIPYSFTATTANREEFQVNELSVYLYGGFSPADIEDAHRRAELCRKPEPGKEQIQKAQDQAQRILSDMGLGQWYVDECYVAVQELGTVREYSIRVVGRPVLAGTEVLPGDTVSALRNEQGHATEASFAFAPEGELLSLSLTTPLNQEQVLKEQAEILPMEVLLKKLQEHLAQKGKMEYPFGQYLKHMKNTEQISCQVEVSELRLGLGRVWDGWHNYRYVPAVTALGTVTYRSGEKVLSADEKLQVLLTVSAEDGSLIQ